MTAAENGGNQQGISARKLLIAAVILVAGAWVANLLIESRRPLVASDVETAIDPSFLPVDELERLVAAYEQRITGVSTPSDYLNLGQLYLEQARVSADPAPYLQARGAFQTAADLSPQDPSPVVGLARTALALHDFFEAAQRARGVLADVPLRVDALAVVADAELAMGNLAEAQTAIERLQTEVGEVSGVLVRRAQLAWLQGHVDESLELALMSIPTEDSNLQRVAWYEAYASNSAFQFGDIDRAEELSASALSRDPNSITALTVASRVSTARGETDRAIELLEQATSSVPDPELNGELGDLYHLVGNVSAAEGQFGLVEVMGTLAEAQGVFNRQVARFYADHDLQHERALGLATAELEIREDPLGFDTYAWTLYRAGRFEDALAAIEKAQAGGFQDAEMSYHEGLIAIALGDGDRARASLERSFSLNPHFDLRGSADARRLLAELK